MTLDEFKENIEDLADLRDVAYDYVIEDTFFDDIYSYDDLDEMVCEDIREFITHNYFYELLPELEDIEVDRSGFYVRNGVLDYKLLDEYDFDSMKEDIMNYLLDNGMFDDDTEQEEEIDDEAEEAASEHNQEVSFECPEVWEKRSEQNAMIMALLT